MDTSFVAPKSEELLEILAEKKPLSLRFPDKESVDLNFSLNRTQFGQSDMRFWPTLFVPENGIYLRCTRNAEALRSSRQMIRRHSG